MEKKVRISYPYNYLIYLLSQTEEEGIIQQKTEKSVPWPLEVDKNGYPILPSTVGKSLPDIKDIVRSFVTLSYRMLSTFSQCWDHD